MSEPVRMEVETKNKRSHRELSNSPEVSVKNKKAREHSNVQPILVKNIDQKYQKDKKNLKEALKDIDSKHFNVVFTKAGNMLIFCKSHVIQEQIFKNEKRFGESSMIKLSDNTQTDQAIVIKGINFNYAQQFVEELKEYGINSIIEMKSFKNPKKPLNVVKATYESYEEIEDILNAGEIKINYEIFSIEPFKKREHIIQCYNCQGFGHKAGSCHNKAKCSRCGQPGHNYKDCKLPKEAKSNCANCHGDHSSGYAGCKKFKEALAKKKLSKDGSSVQAGRSYSDAIKGTEISQESNIMEAAFIQIANITEKFTQAVNDLTNKITEVNSNIIQLIETRHKEIIDYVEVVINQELAKFSNQFSLMIMDAVHLASKTKFQETSHLKTFGDNFLKISEQYPIISINQEAILNKVKQFSKQNLS